MVVVLLELCWSLRRFHISSTTATDYTDFLVGIALRTCRRVIRQATSAQHGTCKHRESRESRHSTCAAVSVKTRVCTQRRVLPALRGPLRSLFLLPLTCAGPDSWLCFLLCLRSSLRCGCRLVVRVCCWHVQFLCSIWLVALRFCWT